MRTALRCTAAAALMALAVAQPHDDLILSLLSVVLGAAGLVLLAVEAKDRPVLAMTQWGTTLVPLSGAWVVPAFETPIEIAGVLLGLAACGGLFYGGAAAVLCLILRGRLERLSFLVLPLAVALAEFMVMKTGLVMAPVGLLAVVGGWAWVVAMFEAIATGGALALLAVVFTTTSGPRVRMAIGVASVLFTIAPAPDEPSYSGPPIYGIAHNPDPVGKWTAQGAQEGLDRLLARSEASRGLGLIVWPENAVSGTFNVEEAIALLADAPKPLLFGMTRFVQGGSPVSCNSAILIDDDGVQISDKLSLAPLMEAVSRAGQNCASRAA